MSASREKQSRQDLMDSGWVDPKATREADQKKKDKRSNTIYAVVGILFALAVIVALVWNSGMVQKKSTAVTIDGENYTAAEVTFYYQNTYSAFLNQFYSVLGYLGYDSSLPPKSQTLNDTAAIMLEAEAGITWHEYIMREALTEMAAVQNGRKQAEAEGFVYPENVALQHEASMMSLESMSAANGLSPEGYLASTFGAEMPVEVYDEHLLATLQYEAYMNAHSDALSYTAEELEAAYELDPRAYDLVSYEYLTIPGDVSSDIAEPTNEDKTAAMEAAKKTAEALLAKYEAGTPLEDLADDAAGIRYSSSDSFAYNGDIVSMWLFDGNRKDGDCEIVEGATTQYIVKLNERFRDEENTVNVRHVLIQPAAGTLTAEDDGYEAEQAQLLSDAKAKAEELYAQWKSGEATEESFAQMAMESSSDSSSVNGGLYSRVYVGQMVAEFNDWCFDSSRKPGDTGIVETAYGYHIIYFCSEDLPRWEVLVTQDLATEDTFNFIDTLSADSVIERHNFGMKFVG